MGSARSIAESMIVGELGILNQGVFILHSAACTKLERTQLMVCVHKFHGERGGGGVRGAGCKLQESRTKGSGFGDGSVAVGFGSSASFSDAGLQVLHLT